MAVFRLKDKTGVFDDQNINSALSNVSINVVSNPVLSTFRYFTGLNDTPSTYNGSDKNLLIVDGDKISFKSFDDLTDNNYLKKTDVINNLSSELIDIPLSAKQGTVLKGLIDNVFTKDQSNANFASYRTPSDFGSGQPTSDKVLHGDGVWRSQTLLTTDVLTGKLLDRPNADKNNKGDIYIVSGDTQDNNGKTFISDSSKWLLIEHAAASYTKADSDARYLKLAGGKATGDIEAPAFNASGGKYSVTNGGWFFQNWNTRKDQGVAVYSDSDEIFFKGVNANTPTHGGQRNTHLNTWFGGQWCKVYHEAFKPTPADIGALPSGASSEDSKKLGGLPPDGYVKTVNQKYNISDPNGWLKTSSSNDYLKLYGNDKSMIFRTDGNTRLGNIGPFPYVFLLGDENKKSSQLMMISGAGDIWFKIKNTWLSTILDSKISNTGGTVAGDLTVTGNLRSGEKKKYKSVINGGVVVKDFSDPTTKKNGCFYYDDGWKFRGGGVNESITTSNSDIQIYKDGAFGTVYHTRNKPKAADIGALAVTGGTVTGDVTFAKNRTHFVNGSDSIAIGHWDNATNRIEVSGGKPLLVTTYDNAIKLQRNGYPELQINSKLTWNGGEVDYSGKDGFYTKSWRTKSVNAAQRYELARFTVDTANWASNGTIIFEVFNMYPNSNGYKKYLVQWGYGSVNPVVRLVEAFGAANEKLVAGAPVVVSGHYRYIPIYLDQNHYNVCTVKVTTAFTPVSTNPPTGRAQCFFHDSPPITTINVTPIEEIINVDRTLSMKGEIKFENCGLGQVGLYRADRFQSVFSMGTDYGNPKIEYRMQPDGTKLTGPTAKFYGIGWTHHNNRDPQAKKILGHHAIFCSNGITKSAVGDHIWTSGNISEQGQLLNARYLGIKDKAANATAADTAGKILIHDIRGSVRPPSYFADRYAHWGFINNDHTDQSGDDWHAINTICKWLDWNASHRQEQMLYTGARVKHRYAISDSAWSAWETFAYQSDVDNKIKGKAGTGAPTGVDIPPVGGLFVRW